MAKHKHNIMGHSQHSNPSRLVPTLFPSIAPWVLYGLALVMLGSTVALVAKFGPTAYFAATGRPFALSSTAPRPAKTDVLPQFLAAGSIDKTTLTTGDTQTITITADANQATSAQIDAWITSPKHKQVWRSPHNSVMRFPANQEITQRYSYTIPANLPRGTYRVSFTLTSADEFTDYAVKEDFAEFNVN